MRVGDKSINLIRDYFSRRTQQVEIGVGRGEKRRSDRGVLQGSGLSPVLFLIYFLRAGVSNKQCPSCKEDVKREMSKRENSCSRCGNNVIYADDLNVISRVKSFSKTFMEKLLNTQGNRINKTLQKISLAMNKKRNQFMCAMSSQRRKASRLSAIERSHRSERLKTNIGGTPVEESDTVKTLGMRFDHQLNFMPYWEEMRKKIQKRSYSIRLLRNNLTFLDRKTLAQGLVLSKLEYCLEASSSCPKSVLKLASKQMNRTVREVTGL